jgi:phosphatidyl-myo-inositol dimannoside synthase
MQPRRVLIIAERYPPDVGGVAAACRRIARGLAGAIEAVHVLVLAQDARPGALETCDDGGVVLHRMGPLATEEETLQTAADLVQYLDRRHGFDLLHGFYVLNAGYLAVVCAKLLGRPSVVSVRGNDLDRGMFRPTHVSALRFVLDEATRVACVSRDLARKAEAITGRAGILAVPNAVDAETFHPAPRDEALLAELFPDSPEGPVLGSVGELRAKKGLHILLEAFLRVRQAVPARLLLVGEARRPERELLRNFLGHHAELAPHVARVDYVHDADALVHHYNLCDVFVAPSLWEGMPNSVLEAMACERLVVASDAGGLPDLIEHGVTGALLDRFALADLPQLLLEVLALPDDARAAMARGARERVLARHSPAGERDAYLSLYAEALAATP